MTVRRVQDCCPVLAQHGQEVLQLLQVFGTDAGGGLVHHDQPRGEAGELRELHQLLDRTVEEANGSVHVQLKRDGPQRRGELLAHLPPVVEEEELPQLPVHEDVLHRAEPREEPGLVVQGEDAQAHRVTRRVPLHGAAVEEEPPRRPRDQPGDDFHQRRLPRTLAADDGANLPTLEAQCDVPQRRTSVDARVYPVE